MRLLCLAMTAILLPPMALLHRKEKPEVPLERAYQARSAEQVYAAMVRAAGINLTNSVQEACVVNMQWIHSSGGWYTVVRVSASCHDTGNGTFAISLSPQVSTNRIRADDFREKSVALFWSNIDLLLTPAGGGSAASR